MDTTSLTSGLKIIMFLVSYAPLFVVLMLLQWPNTTIIYFLIGFTVLPTAIALWALSSLEKLNGRPLKIMKSENRNYLLLEYIVTYIFPFVIPLDTLGQKTAFTLLFIFIGFLYYKSNMFHINPTLALLGYSLSEVETDTGENYSIISKKDISGKKQIFIEDMGRSLGVVVCH